MQAVLVTLASALVALCISVQAATRTACFRGHNHIRTVHNHDHCAHALHAPKVALLFLTTGPLPHEELWRRWFEDVGSLVYTGCADDYGEHYLECAHERDGDPIGRQQLFTVPHYSADLTAARMPCFGLNCWEGVGKGSVPALLWPDAEGWLLHCLVWIKRFSDNRLLIACCMVHTKIVQA